MIERTLVILKPDAVQRGIMGEIISRFEKVGLKIIGLKFISPERENLEEHYEGIGKLLTRKGKEIFEGTIDYMASGPVIGIVMEGVEAVEVVRKMVGTTEPKTALPGTIRADFAHMSYEHANKSGGVKNIVHASADPSEAKLEIAIWFNEDDLVDYTSVHESLAF